MSDMKWVRLVSWHAIRGNGRTQCGRQYSGGNEIVDKLPAGKSCETCLRTVARVSDQ